MIQARNALEEFCNHDYAEALGTEDYYGLLMILSADVRHGEREAARLAKEIMDAQP